jgi:hypothetical protein
MLELIAGSTIVALYLNQVSTTEINAVEKSLTPGQQQELLRVCEREDTKDYERCKLRQLARTKVTGGKSKPTGAYDLYDQQDWSQGRMRDRLQTQRTLDNRRRAAERKTYKEFTPAEDHNTARRSYLNDFKVEQLRCMTEVPHGRPRNICLDTLRNKIRKEMRATSGSMKVIAPEEEQE